MSPGPTPDAGGQGHPRGVLVVIGSGAMGLACARRLAGGRRVVLADCSAERLADAARALDDAGHDVMTREIDVAEAASVRELVAAVATTGELDVVVHTAGISPLQGDSRRIFSVDLYGAALVVDNFFPLARRGTAITLISSGGAYAEPFPDDLERLVATTPTESLLDLPSISAGPPDSRWAYHLAKRAIQLRVQVEAVRWGRVGARINTVSPGITASPMSAHELARRAADGAAANQLRGMIADSPSGRMGTPDDIAAAVAFLSSSDASYITGTDLLVDGGLSHFRRWQELTG